jgi:hypothetical protein
MQAGGDAAVALVRDRLGGEREQRKEATMDAIDVEMTELTDEEVLIYEWRVEQLAALGLSRLIAMLFATLVDWHDVASLVNRGCSPELALEIVR